MISEGFSDDSTMDIVRKLQAEYPNGIRAVRGIWKPSKAGETIAEVTNNAMEKCNYEWTCYVEADEMVHEDNLSFIASLPKRFPHHRSVSFRFIYFRPNLLFEKMGSYTFAIRMVRNYSRPWKRNVRRFWYWTPP